jgi:hypothetical protein
VIPKRPDAEKRLLIKFDSQEDMDDACEEFAEDEFAHEHAVAVRAMEALTSLLSTVQRYIDSSEGDDDSDPATIIDDLQSSANSAAHSIQEIEASGWEP